MLKAEVKKPRNQQNTTEMLITNRNTFRDEDKISWPVNRLWSAMKTEERLK